VLKPLVTALRRVTSDLGPRGYALVGGLAVGARAVSRFTSDVDLVVAVSSDRDAEALVHDLLAHGYRIMAQLEHRETGRFATIRLLPPRGTVEDEATPVVDLLFASTGIEADIVREAELLEVEPSFYLPVARTGHLIAMKVLSASDRRMHDRADLQALIRRCDDSEIRLARQALDAIHAADCGRGRNLQAELDEHIRLARLPPDPNFRPRPLPPAPPPS